MIVETRDMRRRKRPRDPEALLICTRCLKIKSAHMFSYDNVSGRYFCYCKQCKSYLHSVHEYERRQADESVIQARRERNRRDSKRRTKERRESYRTVQNQMSFFVKKIRKAGLTYQEIGEQVGLCRQTVGKIAANEAGYRLRYADVRRVSPLLERLYNKFYPRS